MEYFIKGVLQAPKILIMPQLRIYPAPRGSYPLYIRNSTNIKLEPNITSDRVAISGVV